MTIQLYLLLKRLTFDIINPNPLLPPVTTAARPLTENRSAALNDDIADVDLDSPSHCRVRNADHTGLCL